MAITYNRDQTRRGLLLNLPDDELERQAQQQHLMAVSQQQQPQQQQPQSGGMPNIPTGLLNNFLGGGSATGVGAATGASTGSTGFGLGQPLVSGGVGSASYASGAGAGAGASSAGAAGSGFGGGLAAAGPWAALAAAIIGNETYQRKHGNRPEDNGKYAWQLISGNKLIEQDADTWGEKLDSGNKLGLKGDWQVAGDLTSFDFSNAVKGLDDTFGVKTVKKIFGGLL